jgi:hypothetical protein
MLLQVHTLFIARDRRIAQMLNTRDRRELTESVKDRGVSGSELECWDGNEIV